MVVFLNGHGGLCFSSVFMWGVKWHDPPFFFSTIEGSLPPVAPFISGLPCHPVFRRPCPWLSRLHTRILMINFSFLETSQVLWINNNNTTHECSILWIFMLKTFSRLQCVPEHLGSPPLICNAAQRGCQFPLPSFR